VLFIFTQIDARSSMSSSRAPGASLGTSFISLLAVAQALGKIPADQRQKLRKNIVFVTLDGVRHCSA